MKKLHLLIPAIWLCLTVTAQQQNLLSGKFSKEELSKILISHQKWTPFPKIDDRAGWANADQNMMRAYVKTAEGFLSYQWPSIPATKSLLIERTGDRDEYQTISFKKREVLGTLLLAEIYENKGRFIDQIIDGVWNICEESFWEFLHIFRRQKSSPDLSTFRNPSSSYSLRRPLPFWPG